jgi:hypothetical protein
LGLALLVAPQDDGTIWAWFGGHNALQTSDVTRDTPCSEYNVYVLMTVGEVNQLPKSSLARTPPKASSKPKHKKGKQAKHRH